MTVRRKEPLISGLLSLFLPGAGQVYNENFLKGFILLIVVILAIGSIVHTALSLGFFEPGRPHYNQANAIVRLVISGLILVATWLYGIIDAVVVAGRINRDSYADEYGREIEEGTEGQSCRHNSSEGRFALGIFLLLVGSVAFIMQMGISLRLLFRIGGPLAVILLGVFILIRSTGGLEKGDDSNEREV